MPASPRILPSVLTAFCLLAAGCDRQKDQESAPPAGLAPITVPTSDDPNWGLKPVPDKVAVPALKDPSRALQPLDHFILASLEANALPAAPPADPLTWFRRASIHLTGRPPTPDAIREFVAVLDNKQIKDPQFIYAHTADLLLASAAFGDQLATMWLDTAGYTDLCDPTTDRRNGQWPYRDWVVDSFNANLPYDEFLTAQLAGDLLDSPTPGQLLATAFLRAHPLDHGPDVAPAEAIRRNTTARTDALGNAILGLPLECSCCHDGPDTSITQHDYLSLAAFFDSLAESGEPPSPGVTPGPTLALPDDQQLAAITTAAAGEAATDQLLRQARLAGEEAFLAWHADPLQIPVIPDLAAAFSFDGNATRAPNRSLTGTGFADRGPLALMPGISGKAVQCDGAHAVTMPELFPPARWSEWTFSFWIKPAGQSPDTGILLSHGPGIELRYTNGRLLTTLQRDLPGNAIAILTPEPVVQAGIWTHLAWTYDGSNTADGLRLHVNGQPADTITIAGQLWGPPLPPRDGTATALGGTRDGTPGFVGGIDEFQAFTRALTPPEIAHLHDGRSLPAAKRGAPADGLREYYFSSIDHSSRTLRQQLALNRKTTLEVECSVHEVAVAREQLNRSSPSPRSLPSILPRSPGPPRDLATLPPTRLDLARALTDPGHPLTARVFVNRLWARFFGRGLVASTRNLGPTGAAPLHPDLLDWLARDFVDHDWDVKRLCRRIVLSATYRRSSQATRDQLLRDPGNLLLARYPAHPLPPPAAGEFLLAVTGRLDPTRGGPPAPGNRPFPYRTWSPPPRSHDVDTAACPLGAAPTPTVLESLPRPDEATILTASRLLAQQALGDITDDTARLRFLFATLTGRFPNDAAQAGLDDLLSGLRTRAGQVDAPQLIQPGGTPDSAPPPAELALWTNLVRAILRAETPLRVR